jgi:hypothetical protein
MRMLAPRPRASIFTTTMITGRWLLTWSRNWSWPASEPVT